MASESSSSTIISSTPAANCSNGLANSPTATPDQALPATSTHNIDLTTISASKSQNNTSAAVAAPDPAAEIVVYCICNGPDDGRPMLCCDICSQWFHADCVGMPDHCIDEIEATGATWLCPPCISSGAKLPSPDAADSQESLPTLFALPANPSQNGPATGNIEISHPLGKSSSEAKSAVPHFLPSDKAAPLTTKSSAAAKDNAFVSTSTSSSSSLKLDSASNGNSSSHDRDRDKSKNGLTKSTRDAKKLTPVVAIPSLKKLIPVINPSAISRKKPPSASSTSSSRRAAKIVGAAQSNAKSLQSTNGTSSQEPSGNERQLGVLYRCNKCCRIFKSRSLCCTSNLNNVEMVICEFTCHRLDMISRFEEDLKNIVQDVALKQKKNDDQNNDTAAQICPSKVAEQIELAIFQKVVAPTVSVSGVPKMNSAAAKMYNSRCRTMLTSLRRPQLTLLRTKLVSGEWDAQTVVEISPSQYSDDNIKELEQIRKEELAKVVRSDLPLMLTKKTHKGLEEVLAFDTKPSGSPENETDPSSPRTLPLKGPGNVSSSPSKPTAPTDSPSTVAEIGATIYESNGLSPVDFQSFTVNGSNMSLPDANIVSDDLPLVSESHWPPSEVVEAEKKEKTSAVITKGFDSLSFVEQKFDFSKGYIDKSGSTSSNHDLGSLGNSSSTDRLNKPDLSSLGAEKSKSPTALSEDNDFTPDVSTPISMQAACNVLLEPSSFGPVLPLIFTQIGGKQVSSEELLKDYLPQKLAVKGRVNASSADKFFLELVSSSSRDILIFEVCGGKNPEFKDDALDADSQLCLPEVAQTELCTLLLSHRKISRYCTIGSSNKGDHQKPSLFRELFLFSVGPCDELPEVFDAHAPNIPSIRRDDACFAVLVAVKSAQTARPSTVNGWSRKANSSSDDTQPRASSKRKLPPSTSLSHEAMPSKRQNLGPELGTIHTTVVEPTPIQPIHVPVPSLDDVKQGSMLQQIMPGLLLPQVPLPGTSNPTSVLKAVEAVAGFLTSHAATLSLDQHRQVPLPPPPPPLGVLPNVQMLLAPPLPFPPPPPLPPQQQQQQHEGFGSVPTQISNINYSPHQQHALPMMPALQMPLPLSIQQQQQNQHQQPNMMQMPLHSLPPMNLHNTQQPHFLPQLNTGMPPLSTATQITNPAFTWQQQTQPKQQLQQQQQQQQQPQKKQQPERGTSARRNSKRRRR